MRNQINLMLSERLRTGMMFFVIMLSWGMVEGADRTINSSAVVSITRIWDQAQHSAFTDLIRFQDDLYCTFREGTGHVPGRNGGDGLIRVIRSRDQGATWESFALLEEPSFDLRDPKLSITPDNRLMLNFAASIYIDGQRRGIESRTAIYDPEEKRFGELHKVVLPESIVTGFDWLWRVTWHDGWAWGCTYHMPLKAPRTIHLVRSRDGITYEHVSQLDVPGPSETTLRFLDDGRLCAMLRRRDTGSSGKKSDSSGWIGIASPPYVDWNFKKSNKLFGGPNLISLADGRWLAGSRDYDGNKPTTDLWWLDLKSGQFQEIISFPSGGDNSYPGLVEDEKENRLLVSYYSSHEGKTAIYLAVLDLEVLRAERNQTK
ncbi:MAG TPA: exo-alpha-sialidase [Planctomicrobium sp.]|nr:exo-alpha-sialidase [Planctomicrobium sp.]